MAGTTIVLFTRRVFDFTNVGNALSVEIPMVKAIDVTEWTSGQLIIRVHSGTNVTGATGNAQVLLKVTAPTEEDPAVDFVDPTAVATATINNTVSSAKPTIVRATLSAGFGGMLQCSVKGTGQTSQTVKADISAELVLEA